jgi:hypothetical protein
MRFRRVRKSPMAGARHQALLDAIDQGENERWLVPKYARNALTHHSEDAVEDLNRVSAELDPGRDTWAFGVGPPTSVARTRVWLATDVGEPTGCPSSRLWRTRLAHLQVALVRIVSAMGTQRFVE